MKYNFFVFLLFSCSLIIAQENCGVLLTELQGTYEGGCKDGLASGKGIAIGTDSYTGSFKKGYPHGFGIYTWASGEKYNGEWRMGKRDGEGEYSCIKNGRDTLLAGLWKDGNYLGPKPVPPKIITRLNVNNISFYRKSDGNALNIMFYQIGRVNIVESIDISTSSGGEFQTGTTITIRNIVFPLYCKIKYVTWNSLHTLKYDCTLEFEITQPGNWDLRLEN